MKPGRNSIPYIRDIKAIIQDKSVFTIFDHISAYNHFLITPEHISKTAITTQFGLFKSLHVSFRKKGDAVFQRFIDHVLNVLHFICVNMKDVLITSFSMEEYSRYVRFVFKLFEKFGIIM